MSSLDRLYRDVENLKRQYKGLAGGPQLALSSIENGSIDSKDADGNLKMTIGEQDDGGNTINVLAGPTPPTPTGFTVDTDYGKLIAHWSGNFDGEALAPSDWSRAEVHASQDPFFVPSRATARGSIVSAAGGEVTIGVLKGPWTIKMLAWSQAGKMSAPSAPVDVEVPGYGDLVQESIDVAQELIDHAKEVLEQGQLELAGKLADAEAELESVGYDIDLVRQAQSVMEGTVTAVQASAEAAQQAAWDADSKAVTAKNAADQAATEAAAAAGIANGKGKIIYGTSAPGAADRNTNTLWIDTTNGANTPKRWTTGATWVAVTDKAATDAAAAAVAAQSKADAAKTAADQAKATADAAQVSASAAADLATQAMTSANSKNRITRSTANPPTTYDGRVDDVWWKMTTLSAGGRVLSQSRWNGTAWLVETIDSAVLAYVDAAKITTGFLDVAALIRAGAITADKLLIGGGSNLLVNPLFGNNAAGTSSGLTLAGADGKDGAPYVTTAAASAQSGGYLGATSGSDSKYRAKVSPGAVYKASVWARSVADIPASKAALYFRFFTPADLAYTTYTWGTPSNISNTTVIPANTWIEVSALVTAPPGAVELSVGLYSQASFNSAIEFCQPAIRPAVDGTLITPAGIQTPHLAADVLEVKNLKAGTGQMAEAVIAKLFTDVVVARMAQAQEFIGENAILTGAVTAPKITASEELWAKLAQFVTVRAEMMDADVFIGRRFEGVDISASRFTAGTAVEITDSYGIRQFGPDGALNVSLPSDGSTAWISADIRAKSLTVTGAMSVEGPAKIASGGQLQLESGVTPPATPPNVSAYVKRTPFPVLAANENAVGLAFDGTHFWRAVDSTVTDAPDRMERIDVNGNLVSSFEHSFWVRNGITIIGSEIFALGIEEGANRDKSKRFIYVYDFTGTFKRKWEYAAYGSGTYQPGIGTDGTYIYVAQCWASGEITWRQYDKNTGVGQNRYDSTHRLNGDVVSANMGTFDFGSSTMVLTKANENGPVEIYNPTTGALVSAGGWYAGDKEQVRGTAWANGRFHHLTAAGNLVTMSTTKYPSGSAGPETEDWWVAASWVNGSNETTIGPVRKFAWRRRAGIQVSAGAVPTGVAKVRIYLGRKATEPSRTELASLVTGVAADSVLRVTDLSPTWAVGANPPAVNSFPNSTPGLIRSTAGGFEVRGDGSGKWGPLTFNADGTMSSSAVPAWIPITTFATGYGPQTWGFVPAYRIWPDGKVEWRGVVAMTGTPPSSNNMTTGSADVLTIPVAARPTQPVNVAAASTSGINLRRIEFSPASASTVLRFYNGGQTGTWVSLETIYYYLT